jgi:hypothetical protein
MSSQRFLLSEKALFFIVLNVIREEKHGGLIHECRRNNKAPWDALFIL